VVVAGGKLIEDSKLHCLDWKHKVEIEEGV
jgi:hypothetical protein